MIICYVYISAIVRNLIIATLAGERNAAIAQVRFCAWSSLVRCGMRKLAMTVVGHLLPVIARQSRQLYAQKLPVLERSVTLAAVPLKLPNADWPEGARMRRLV
jgi:hypothetical protein